MDIEPPKHPNKPLSKQFANELLAHGVPPPTGQPQPPEPPRQSTKLSGDWREAALVSLLIGGALALGFFIITFGIRSYQVDGQSMETTLQNKDWLIVDKIPRTWARLTHHGYIPRRGSIIVFNQSGLF